MTRAEYLAYLQSPWWRARKQLVIRYRGERCERCGSVNHIELHHRSYERLGCETPDDVELLCRRCHLLTHGLTEDDRNEFDRLRLTDGLQAWLHYLEQKEVTP